MIESRVSVAGELNKNEEPSIYSPIWRGIGYSITSLFAHTSGYLLQSNSRSFGDFILVFALWVTSVPFFFDYANSYHVEDPLGHEDEMQRKWAKSQARRIIRPGAAFFVVFLLISYYALERKWPNAIYDAILLVFAITFYCYGGYTIRHTVSRNSEIRHQLVWPVVFSIALPLYSGIIFSGMKTNWAILWPILVLGAFFLFSLWAKRMLFLTSGVLILFSIIITRIFVRDGDLNYFFVMTFYLCIAAYLAVFEAWGITASLALREYITVRETDASENPYLPQSTRYYLSSFGALSLAALTLPMVFIFSDYGRIFFWGITFHSLAALLTWFWAGGGVRKIGRYRNHWLWGKTAVGFIFLSVLVGDALTRNLPIKRALVNLKGPGALSTTIALSALAITSRYNFDKRQYKEETGKELDLVDWVKRLHKSRSGILVHTILLSLVMAFGTLVIEGLQGQDQNAVLFKSDRVFFFYLLAALINSILLAFKGGARISMQPLLGLILSARLFTSVMIGMAVFLPALRAGSTVTQAILACLPFFLASAGGFLLNDACDYERDVISKPFRPLPRGLMERRTAWLAGFVLVLLASGFTFWGAEKFSGWLTQALAILGVVVYNTVTARFGFMKAPFAALLCMLPLVFVVNTYGYPSDFWWVIAGGYTFCIGRELLMDILDIKGDRETGLRTLPMMLGAKRSEAVALLCVTFSVAALVAFLSSSKIVLHQAQVIISVAFLFILGALWKAIQAPQNKRQIIRLSWIPMLLMLATFL